MIAFVRTIFCAYIIVETVQGALWDFSLWNIRFRLVTLTHTVNARRIASVRHDTSRRTLTNWRTLSSLRMMHVGRWQPAAVHHSRDATQRMHLSTHASAAETSSATRPIIHRVADRWSLPRNYRLGIRDTFGIFVAYLDYYVGWNVTASWRDVGKYRILRRASRSAMTNESH